MKSYKIYIVLFIFLVSVGCKQQQSAVKVEGQLVEIKDTGTDEEFTALIAPYKKKLDSNMNEIIGVSEIEMDKGKPEGLLGNFIADLLLKIGNEYNKSNKPIDFCIINNGGLRSTMPKGNITKGKIFELMPFENELVVITLDRSALDKMFSYIANKGGAPISGFELEIKQNKSYNVSIDGKGLSERNYKVLTSDYLAAGGSRMTFFADSLKKEVLNLKVRDAIIEYIQKENNKGNSLNSELDKRIFYAK